MAGRVGLEAVICESLQDSFKIKIIIRTEHMSKQFFLFYSFKCFIFNQTSPLTSQTPRQN